MPFWRLHSDFITNVLLMELDNDVAMLSTSYDRTIRLSSMTGDEIASTKLPVIVGAGSLATLPPGERKLSKLSSFVVGSEYPPAKLLLIDASNLQIVAEHTLKEERGRITFIKGFPDIDVIIVGTTTGLYLMRSEDKFSFTGYPLGTIATDAEAFRRGDEILVATCSSAKRKVWVFMIQREELKRVAEFELPDSPIQIAWNAQLEELVIATRNGLIARRKINGERVFNHRAGVGQVLWKNLVVWDVTGDGSPEIIIGTQIGHDESSRATRSVLNLFKIDEEEPIFTHVFKGWIKLIYPLRRNIVLSAGKLLGIYKFSSEEKVIQELVTKRFDKPPIAYSVLEKGDRVFVGLGFSEGEVGVCEFPAI